MIFRPSSQFAANFAAVTFVVLAGTISAAPSASTTVSPTPAPQVDPKLFSGMRWRQVGPFRGGRALAIEGVLGEPNTWYFGAVAGGVWKTTDGGANWSLYGIGLPDVAVFDLAISANNLLRASTHGRGWYEIVK